MGVHAEMCYITISVTVKQDCFDISIYVYTHPSTADSPHPLHRPLQVPHAFRLLAQSSPKIPSPRQAPRTQLQVVAPDCPDFLRLLDEDDIFKSCRGTIRTMCSFWAPEVFLA